MAVCPDNSKLECFLAERLDPGETSLIEQHVSTCPRCCEQLATLADVALPIAVSITDKTVSHHGLFELAGRIADAIGDRLANVELRKQRDAPECRPSVSGYVIYEVIGQGGMGTVYRAHECALDREVAFKVLSTREGADREQFARRFAREAKLTALLDHPSVVPIYGFGIDDFGRAFYTMRLVRGRSLKDVFALARAGQDGWNRTRALAVLARICQTVAFAHGKGVMHRDLKPSNIMVGQLGEVYILDWGLARAIGESGCHDIRLNLDDRDDGQTTAEGTAETIVVATRDLHDPCEPLKTIDGAVVGTPAYMPPEQAAGKVDDVDQLADVYSLGAILYELLAGNPPYRPPQSERSPLSVLKAVLAGPPEPLARCAADAPPELVAICDKAMARERDQRYPSALEVAEDLQAYLDDRVVKAHRTGAFAEAKKWVVRNRVVATVAIATLVLGVISFTAHTWWQGKVNRDLFLANQAKAAALGKELQTSGKLANSNRQLEDKKRELEKTNALIAEAAAREERAKLEAYSLLAESYANFGELEAKAGRNVHAALWFANAAELSEQRPDIQHTHRMRALQFGRAARVPIAAYWDRAKLKEIGWLSHGHSSRFAFDPSKRYLLMKARDQGQTHGEYWAKPRIIDIWNENRQLWGNARFDAVAFALDGRHVAVSPRPGLVEIRRLSDEQLVQTLPFDGNQQTIEILDYSHNGRLLFVGATPARLWDVEQSRFLKSVYPASQEIVDVGFSDDDRQVLVVTNQNGLKLFDVADEDGPREPINTTEESTKLLARFALRQRRTHAPTLPDGTPVPGELRATFGKHGSEVGALDFDVTGRFAATVHHNGVVRLWQATPPRPYWFIRTPGWARAVMSDDSTLIAPVGDLTEGPAISTTQVYNSSQESAAGPLLDVGFPILSGCFSSDNQVLALICGAAIRNRQTMFLSDGQAGSVQFWDWKAGKLIGDAVPMPSEPRSIAWHPKKNLVAVGCIRGEVMTVDATSRESSPLVDQKAQYEEPPRWGAHGYKGGGIDFDSTGDLLFWWGFEKSWKVLDFATGRTQVTWPSEQSLPTEMAAHEDIVVISNANHRARMYDVKTGAFRGNAILDGGEVAHLSRCGGYVVATAQAARSITVWDIKNRRSTCGEFGIGSTDANFIHGTPFILSTANGAIHFWDRLTGSAVAPPLRIPGCSFAGVIRVAHDGRFAAITCRPYGLLILDLRSFHADPLQGLSPPDALLLAELNSCATIRDGRLVDLPSSYNVESENNGWIYRWDDFKSRNPNFHRRDIPRELAIRDHQTRADEYKILGNTNAAAFHRRTAEQLRTANDVAIAPLPPPTQEEIARANEEKELARLTQAVSEKPDNAYAWRERAAWYASRGQWKESADDLLEVVKLAPEETAPYLQAAPLLFLAGDEEGYRTNCREMLRRFGNSTVIADAERTIKTCTLQPGAVELSELPLKVLDDALAAEPANVGLQIWGSAARSLYALRAGNPEGAITWAQKCLDLAVSDQQRAFALAVQALSHQKLGRADAARDALNKAAVLIDAALAQFRSDPNQRSWQDWLIADILRREALNTPAAAAR